MEPPPKLTTALACRVARIERERFNEAVAAGYFDCAPKTVAGRARAFDPDDMIALYLYRELTEDGYTREKAGRMACAVAVCAKANPNANAISFVENYFAGAGDAFPADQVPDHAEWDNVVFSGADIRKVTTFRIGKMRKLIAHYTAEEISTFGPEDGSMSMPTVHKPAEIAAHLGVSERLVRETARAHGACRIVGKTMVLTDDDLGLFMEAIQCPSKSTGAASTTEAPLTGSDFAALQKRLTDKSQKG